jgi:hypothetical protein
MLGLDFCRYPEILDDIIDFLDHDLQDRRRLAALASLSRVSHFCYDRTIRVMYKRIVLGDGGMEGSFWKGGSVRQFGRVAAGNDSIDSRGTPTRYLRAIRTMANACGRTSYACSIPRLALSSHLPHLQTWTVHAPATQDNLHICAIQREPLPSRARQASRSRTSPFAVSMQSSSRATIL